MLCGIKVPSKNQLLMHVKALLCPRSVKDMCVLDAGGHQGALKYDCKWNLMNLDATWWSAATPTFHETCMQRRSASSFSITTLKTMGYFRISIIEGSQECKPFSIAAPGGQRVQYFSYNILANGSAGPNLTISTESFLGHCTHTAWEGCQNCQHNNPRVPLLSPSEYRGHWSLTLEYFVVIWSAFPGIVCTVQGPEKLLMLIARWEPALLFAR